MDQIQFSPIQHLLHPFTFSSPQGEKVDVSKLRGKVAIVALAIITGILGSIFAGIPAGIAAAGAVFYALTGYYKIRVISDFQKNNPNTPSPNKNHPTPAIIEKEPEQPPKIDLPPLEEPIKVSPKDLKKEEPTPKLVPLFSFFEDTFKPALDQIFAKAADRDQCFIRQKTGPFLTWIQNEYNGYDNKQTRNLHYLTEKRPELEHGLFIDIRGDGDCTFRSIGAGLLLQSCLEEPLSVYEKLFNKFEQITNQLEGDTAAIGEKIIEIRDEVEKMRREAEQSEALLKLHPKQYHDADGKMTKEGSDLKTGFDEKREIASIIESQVEALNLPQNQKAIQEQVAGLKLAHTKLTHYFQEFKGLATPDEVQRKMVELMGQEEFDQSLIIFLRKASSLNIALNGSKMGNYLIHLKGQEEVILGELSIFELLMRRANAIRPGLGQELLQGTINDALSLSNLFQQPLSWYRSEVYFEPEDKIIYDFMPECKNEKKKPFFLLNRPGHTDLILV